MQVTGIRVTDSSGVVMDSSYPGGGCLIATGSYGVITVSSGNVGANGIPTGVFTGYGTNNSLTQNRLNGLFKALGSIDEFDPASNFVRSAMVQNNLLLSGIDTSPATGPPYATVTIPSGNTVGRIRYIPSPTTNSYASTFLIETSTNGTNWTKYKILNFSENLGVWNYPTDPLAGVAVGSYITNTTIKNDLTAHVNNLLLAFDAPSPQTLSGGVYGHYVIYIDTNGFAHRIQYENGEWYNRGFQTRGTTNMPETAFEIPVTTTFSHIRVAALTVSNFEGSTPKANMGTFLFFSKSPTTSNTGQPAEVVAYNSSSPYGVTNDLLGRNTTFFQDGTNGSKSLYSTVTWNVSSKTYNSGVPSWSSSSVERTHDILSVSSSPSLGYWNFTTLVQSKPALSGGSWFVGVDTVTNDPGNPTKAFTRRTTTGTDGSTYGENPVAGNFVQSSQAYHFVSLNTSGTNLYSLRFGGCSDLLALSAGSGDTSARILKEHCLFREHYPIVRYCPDKQYDRIFARRYKPEPLTSTVHFRNMDHHLGNNRYHHRDGRGVL